MKKYFLIGMLFVTALIYPQENNQSDLTIAQIMQAENFIGVSPTNIFWSEDSRTIYFTWNPELEKIKSLYKYELAFKKTSKVSVSEEKSLIDVYDFDYNSDKSKKVYAKGGDVYLYELASNSSKKLITTFNERESNVSFTADGNTIIFERNDNLFQFDLKNGTVTQLTNFKSGSKKAEKKVSEQDQWLENQQQKLFEVLRDRKEKKEITKEHAERLKDDKPSAIYLNGKHVSNIIIGKNGDFVTYKLSEFPDNTIAEIPHFVNETGYTSTQKTYDLTGAKQVIHELWVFDFKLDSTYQVTTKSLAGIYTKPLYLKEYDDDFNPKYETPKSVNFFNPKNSPDGNSTVVEIRSTDNKDRWFAKIDYANGTLIELNHQHDEAWIAGPGIPWQQSGGNWDWINNESIFFHSEKTGFSHLYQVNVNSKKEKALTKGNWEVHEAELSNDRKSMYITTNEVHPGERQFYKLNLKNLRRDKLTNQTGNNEVTISPNEMHFAIRQSFSNVPWELFLLKNESKSQEEQITKSTTKEFESYSWKIPENITFKASDGVEIYARLYQPEGGSDGKPMVVFVHGAGYLQNAHKWWSGYFREYMFHNILVDNGFVVIDVDYRASKGYGRNFRTEIYRHMGGKDLSDQVDAVNFMMEKYGVDKNNVGIYGGSYGGFITLMGMFNAPDTFKSGAGIRSVTDWAHYHHAYTANILNTPVLDPISYQRSSPINFADGLEGNLLILHGMIDDNVHFQDVVRLNQRLIELGKEDWQMAVYPLERHGFIEPSSWTDEYKRIYKLFAETLKE
ncbi:MAG: prolyl oligopeptidase family serine peptidase [Flavobacteriaceae bacterium]